ncbi:hypothetical protein KBB25_03105 [Candidatus Gracilibacteria bacterium]|nr:hypothetical protein [Candidatus Gracilibacteria bacterium]
MNSISEHPGEESFSTNIVATYINLLIVERYATYCEELKKYYIEITDHDVFDKFSLFYNQRADLGKFFNVKQKEYLSLRLFLFKLSEVNNKKISGRLSSIEKDFIHGTDAIIGYGKKQFVGIDFTFQLSKKDSHVVCCHMPFAIVEAIRQKVVFITEKDEFEKVLTQEMNNLPDNFYIKIVASGKEYSLSEFIPALKIGAILGGNK